MDQYSNSSTRASVLLDVNASLRADLHGTIFVACGNGLRQAHDMIYDCCVRQKKCRSILKHVLKRCDNRKSCRRPVVSLSHATKSYRVNRPLLHFELLYQTIIINYILARNVTNTKCIRSSLQRQIVCIRIITIFSCNLRQKSL